MLLNAKEAVILPSISLYKDKDFKLEINKGVRLYTYYRKYQQFIDTVSKKKITTPDTKEINEQLQANSSKFSDKEKKRFVKGLKKKLSSLRDYYVNLRRQLIREDDKYKEKEDLFLFDKKVNDFLYSLRKSSTQAYFTTTRDKYDQFKRNLDGYVPKDAQLSKRLKHDIKKRMQLVDEFPVLFVLLSRQSFPNTAQQLEELLKFNDDDDQRLALKAKMLRELLEEMDKSLLSSDENDKRPKAKTSIKDGALITDDRALIDHVEIGVDLKKLDAIDINMELMYGNPTYVFNKFRNLDAINCQGTNELRATRDIKINEILCRDMTDEELMTRAGIKKPRTFISIQELKARHQLTLTQLTVASAEENEAKIDMKLRIALLDRIGNHVVPLNTT